MEARKLVPENKFDFSNLDKLKEVNEREFKVVGQDVLEWLQDKNWPIYPEVLKIVILRQELLIEEIQNVLKGNDEIWKHNLLEDVISERSPKSLQIIKKDI